MNYSKLNGDRLAEFMSLSETMTNKELAVHFGYSMSQIQNLKKRHGVKSKGSLKPICATLDDDIVREIRMFYGSVEEFNQEYGTSISSTRYWNIKNGKTYNHI